MNMHRHFASVLVIAALACAGTVTSASASPFRHASVHITPTPIPSNAIIVGSDSRRYVTYVRLKPGPARWRTLDLRTRHSAPVALPEAGCTIEAAGTGGLAARCLPNDAAGPRIFLARAPAKTWMRFVVPPAALHGEDPSALSTLDVGKQWVSFRLTSSDPHDHGSIEYLSRADGTIVNLTALPRTAIANLDAADVSEALCTPIQRESEDSLNVMAGYARPWAMWLRYPTASSSAPRVTLQHCGSSHQTTVCVTACGDSPTVGPTYATWSRRRDGFVRRLHHARTTRIHVPGKTVTVSQVGPYLLAHLNAGDTRAGQTGIVRLSRRSH